jgi:hypothetical protein
LVELEHQLDTHQHQSARYTERLIHTMSPYRLDFPRVAREIRSHLTDAQKLEVESAADKLGVILTQPVTLSRSEAPFRSTTKRL